MSNTVKNCFKHKKGDLSNKLNNEEERKKARESSLDLLLSKETNDNSDVFIEGLRVSMSCKYLYMTV